MTNQIVSHRYNMEYYFSCIVYTYHNNNYKLHVCYYYTIFTVHFQKSTET